MQREESYQETIRDLTERQKTVRVIINSDYLVFAYFIDFVCYPISLAYARYLYGKRLLPLMHAEYRLWGDCFMLPLASEDIIRRRQISVKILHSKRTTKNEYCKNVKINNEQTVKHAFT